MLVYTRSTTGSNAFPQSLGVKILLYYITIFLLGEVKLNGAL